MRIGVREVIFSTNCFIAAILALFISLAIGLDQPYWAMITVYVTSQPLSGGVKAKAAYRLIGTLLGGIAAVILVPIFLNNPEILSLILSLWIAVCLFISLLDQTPRSYLFMLSGYTVAIVAFPMVNQPELIFSFVVARVEEIAIGVICATILHSTLFPLSVTDSLKLRLNAILNKIKIGTMEALSFKANEQSWMGKLSSEVTEIHKLSAQIPFDTAAIRPTKEILAKLESNLIHLLPLISAIEDRVTVLKDQMYLSYTVTFLIHDIKKWMSQPSCKDFNSLVQRCDSEIIKISLNSWNSLLLLNLLTHLREMIQIYSRTRILINKINWGDYYPQNEKYNLFKGQVKRALHVDYNLALLSSFSAIVAILICCAIWILTGWPDGASAPTMAAITCCFFSVIDDPVPAQKNFFFWAALSAPLAFIYTFLIFPHITNFELLVVVLAPLLLFLGAFMALPKWYGKMLPLIANFLGGVALTLTYSADEKYFINQNIASLFGILVAIIVTRGLRSLSSSSVIERLKRSGWYDLSKIALLRFEYLERDWKGRMSDRVGQIALRINEMDEDEKKIAECALRDLRLGISIINLPPNLNSNYLSILKNNISQHFFRKASGLNSELNTETLVCLDEVINELLVSQESNAREILVVLAGLRRNLFPNAPAWNSSN